MVESRTSRRALVFAWGVVISGAGVGIHLLLQTRPEAWNWPAIAVFGSMTLATSAVSLTHRTHLPKGIAHQAGTAFFCALFLLSDPASVCLLIWIASAADWAMNRRGPLKALFNLGQLTLALGAALAVRETLRPGFSTLDGVDPRTMAAAALSIVAFVAVNMFLTQVVSNLANHRPWLQPEGLTLSGVLNEGLCLATGLGMAVLWWVEPWLSVLGAMPLWIVMLLLVALSRREQQLALRERELESLQGLGLRIGSELDVERLWDEVVRVTSAGLQASGALLAFLDPADASLVVRAHHGLPTPPGPRLRISRLGDGFFETGTIRLVEPFDAKERELYPELDFLPASGMLCAPLAIPGRREGLLVVWHGGRRRAFDADDVRRLDTLVRFVNVALSNAELVAEKEPRRRRRRLASAGPLSSREDSFDADQPLGRLPGTGDVNH